MEGMASFILTIFGDMNNLWTRMQYQTIEHDKERAELERMDIGSLIGFGLSLLAELNQMDDSLYANQLLPTIFDHVLSCKDFFAQEYIIESLIEVNFSLPHKKNMCLGFS
jgi:hypothetical protein